MPDSIPFGSAGAGASRILPDGIGDGVSPTSGAAGTIAGPELARKAKFCCRRIGEIILDFPPDLVATPLPDDRLAAGVGTLELLVRMADIDLLVCKVNFDGEK